MRIFPWTKSTPKQKSPTKRYNKPTEDQLQAKQEREEKREAWTRLVKKMRENPELEREFILKKMGFELKPPDPEEVKQKEFRSRLIDEAMVMINEDDDLRRQYAEGMIGEILGGPKRGSSRRRDEPEDFYQMPGSSISQALEEIDSLAALKQKMEEMGMSNGGGKGGFFGGLTMKDLVGVFPYLASMLGKGQPDQPQMQQPQSSRTYVVEVNGQKAELPEAQYLKMLQEGTLAPVASVKHAPEAEKPEESAKPEPEPIKSLELFHLLDPDEFLTWMETDPETFVLDMKTGADQKEDTFSFLWGFFSTVTNESILDYATRYKEHPEYGLLAEKILSDEGKAWLEKVLEMVNEINQLQ